jgi:biopolymer transport protein ExbD
MAIGSQFLQRLAFAWASLLSFGCSEPQSVERAESPAQAAATSLTLKFKAGQAIEFAGQSVTTEQLRQRLTALTASGQHIAIQIEVDRATERGYFGETMKMLSQFPGVIAGVVGGT